MRLDDQQRPTVREVLLADGDGPPDLLLDHAAYAAPPHPIDKARYHAPEWHAREVEHIWRRTWQMACREEEMAEPGDYVVYDIAQYSIIVLRAGDGSIGAFYNSCRHRGSQLLPSGSCGSVERLRCPYHGWTYDLDGQLADLPCDWDFPQFAAQKPGLVPVRTESWGGFVFVNMDPDAMPLRRYLGKLCDHVPEACFTSRHIGAHVAKVIACNWKVGLEAFLEGYHVAEVHPQALPFTGDTNGQLDVWPPHVSRMIANVGLPSPRMENRPTMAETSAALRAFLASDMGAVETGAGDVGQEEPRKIMAAAIRAMLADATGVDHADRSTSEIIDAINYHVFPNWMPWLGFGTPIVYRLRPYGDDPDRAILEVYLLYATDPGKARPAAAEVRWLAESDSWTAAAELGGLGAIFDQDEQNFLMIQRGLKAGGCPTISPSDYQESRIRFFHDIIDHYMKGAAHG